MRPEAQAKLEPFFHKLSAAPQAALLLDYDGTLAPFQIRREQAVPYAGVALVLQGIVRNGRTRVVVISGRDANELIPMLDLQPRPEIWGVHGLQRMRMDGTIAIPRLSERTRNGLSDAERWLNYQQLLHTAEFKPGGIAVHWRGLGDLVAEDLRSRVLLGWRLIAAHSELTVLEFDGGVEILAPGANKGAAVGTLLNEIAPTVPVAYLGDDNTDESAFCAIGDRGISVLVRPQYRQTSAQLWLKPPEEVFDFLGLWLAACGQHTAGEGSAAKAMNG